MKKEKGILQICPALWMAGMVGMATMSCGSPENKVPRLEGPVAQFDHFIYQGYDDFYCANPLPDDSSFYNPLLPGWYSDPSVCTNGKGDYFLATSTFVYFPGVPLFHSRDLVNWTQVGHVLTRPSQLVNMQGQGISGGIFAPALSYNPHNETYYMVTTNVGAGNFYVKTKDPFGEWSDPIMLPEVPGIDPSFFFDDDGKAYIVNNDDAPDNKPEYDGHRTIRIQEFDVEHDKTVGPRTILVNKGAHPEDNPIWIEGPHLFKVDGKYFLMSAEGGTGDGHSEVIFRGDSPMGPFEPWKNNPILTQRHLGERPTPITCAGHAQLIQAVEGDWWAVFLACRPIDGRFENLGRETFMMPVRWSEDGFPYMTQGNDVVPMILKRKGVKRSEEHPSGNFTVKDDFDGDTLGMQWMTLRGPATDLYSLTDNPGFLTLACGDKTSTEKDTPALVCRRMQHHKFESIARMAFTPSDDKEAAGMLLKDETHQFFLGMHRNRKGKCVTVWKIGADEKTVLAEAALPDWVDTLDLRVSSTGKLFRFYYAMEQGIWKSLVEDVEAGFFSTAEAGGFTGSVIGLYATKNK